MQLRVPLPARVRLDALAACACALLLGQLATGTGIVYALLIWLYVVVTGLTINQLGGFRSIGAICVLSIALKIVVISQVVKVLLRQPADEFLRVPVTTASLLLLGALSIYLAAIVASKVAMRPRLRAELDTRVLWWMAVISYAIGAGSYFYIRLFGIDPASGDVNVGGLLSLARQLMVTESLAIVCATAYTIIQSGGRRSLGWLSTLAVITQFIFGLLYASKELMFEPFLYYLLTCVAFGFTFRARHLAGGVLALILGVTILYPFSQVGRNFVRSANLWENVQLTKEFLSNMSSLQDLAIVDEQLARIEESYSEHFYYGRAMGLLDRFSLIEQVDALAKATLDQGDSGWTSITPGFALVVPHFLYPNKPIFNTANYLGHRIGSINPEDMFTQVSFGFVAEAFTAFHWLGALLIPFVLMVPFFLLYDRLAGRLSYNIWGAFLIGYMQHDLVEATIAVMMAMLTVLPIVIACVYLLTAVPARLLAGPEAAAGRA